MINIFSVHANRTDFLELQYISLKHFLKDEFNYYCIDNFLNKEQSWEIKDKCKTFDINYVKFKNYTLFGNSRDHALALNSIKNISSDKNINVIVDFDLFAIDNFCIEEFIGDYDIAGVYQQRDNFNFEYLAPFLIIVNKNRNFSNIDFDISNNPSADVGANTSRYLRNKKYRPLKHTSSLTLEKDKECFTIDYDPLFGCQIIESSFLHYYRGTNWDKRNKDYQNKKNEWLVDAISSSIDNKILNKQYLELYQNVFNHSFNYWNGSNEKFKSILNPY